MKVWITKNALTKGVYSEDDAKLTKASAKGAIVSYHCYFSKKDWHDTEIAALARAERMRFDKIHLLKRQIARLEALRFSPDPPFSGRAGE